MRKISFKIHFAKKIFALFFTLFCAANVALAEEIHVCVGSFKNQENAKNLSRSLDEAGETTFIFETQVNGETFFRVLLSKKFDDKFQARSFRDSFSDSQTAKNLNLKGLWICEAVPEAPKITENEVVLEENQNEEIPINEEKPYSVLVRSYKEEQAAENTKERLSKSDIDSYILKTFDDDSYFSFDLHSGAFDSPEQAEELQTKLSDLGIEGTKVSDFIEEKPKIEKYDEMIKAQPVVFDSGNTEIPDIYSAPVATLIRQFPVNRNFTLEKLEIYDYDNLKKLSESIPEFDEFYDFLGDSSKIHAASVAYYKDDLFGKNVTIFISSGEENSFNGISEIQKLAEEKSSESTGLKMQNTEFRLKDGILTSVIFSYDKNHLLYGVNGNRDLAIFMLSEDFSDIQFEDFLSNFESDASLLVYPQVRKTLLVLPQKTETERDFLKFTLAKVEDSYAAEKGYADWAIPIVGHWEAQAEMNQNDGIFSVAFFDLDYNYNASRIHEMFMEAHVVDDLSHPSNVLEDSIDSWYVNVWGNNEVSFSTKSYIIAVDSDNLQENSLVDIADDLQIWK